MQSIQLNWLGQTRVQSQQGPIAIKRRKGVALLALLTMSAAPESREKLAALLWPDADRKSGLAFLRRALWSLRQNMPPAIIASSRSTLRYVGGDAVWIDVFAFRALLTQALNHDHVATEGCAHCAGQLQRAIALYQGDFLADFTLEDNRPFEEWRHTQQTLLHAQLLQAYEHLLSHLWRLQREEEALRYANCWLQLDPLSEQVYRNLIYLYAATGRPQDAIKQVEQYRRTYAQELGAAPNPEIITLYDCLIARQPLPPTDLLPASQALYPPQQPNELPVLGHRLIGRDQQLATLVERMRDDSCRLLTVVGPGGVGKSALAIAAAKELHQAYADDIIYLNLEYQLTEPCDRLLKLLQLPDIEPLTRLAHYFRRRRTLIIIDNYRPTASGSAQLAKLLDKTAETNLLLTASEPLRLREEWILRLDALPFPPVQNRHPPAHYPAVQLFLDRALQQIGRAIDSPEEVRTVAAICRLLDGNPLAIEQAAALTPLMSASAIAAEVEQNLDVLHNRFRDGIERHRTLRTLFFHSWNCLEERYQYLLRQLAVFEGEFDRQMARHVTGATLAELAALIDKSQLQTTSGDNYRLSRIDRHYLLKSRREHPNEITQLFRLSGSRQVRIDSPSD